MFLICSGRCIRLFYLIAAWIYVYNVLIGISNSRDDSFIRQGTVEATTTAWIPNVNKRNHAALLQDVLLSAASSSSKLPWINEDDQEQSKTSRAPQLSPPIEKSTTTSTIRLRKTIESDISDIASFLATASKQLVPPKTNNPWQNNIDLLFAKSDIEKLLLRRCRILDLGNKAAIRTRQQLLQQQQQSMSNMNGMNRRLVSAVKQQSTEKADIDDHLFLKYLWSTNDVLRTEIQIAAGETGEDTIWNHHTPFIITPSSIQWFNHVQISAVTTTTKTTTPSSLSSSSSSTKTQQQQQQQKGLPNILSFFNTKQKGEEDRPTSKVVGFCEVAMLINPTYNNHMNQTETDCVILILDPNQPQNDRCNYYTPAIANLAIANDMRRQGIATKLLQSAERYVRIHWDHHPRTSMGLYVSCNNHVAIQLYEKCGYNKVVLVDTKYNIIPYNKDDVLPTVTASKKNNNDGNDENGLMWYMSKRLR